MRIPPKSVLSGPLLVCVLFHMLYGSLSKIRGNCKSMNAAFSLNDSEGTYFLSGTEYIEYNFRLESEGKVGPIAELGLDLKLRDVEAAYRDTNGSINFLMGCHFYRYHISEQHIRLLQFQRQGFLKDLGLQCNVDAALNWAGQVLVFRGCEVWRWNPLTTLFELEGQTSSRGLPCQIEASVEWGPSDAIFIKGTQFWKFEKTMLGPFHTDNLHLCSWYLCGEADWMNEKRRGHLKCNGDNRLCDLRINQVTLAGLHNAGSGFAGGFHMLNCWMRNHAENISRQMELGIRHLDIDPCHDTCGLLGTCHSFMCGGSICAIIKQVRDFLRQNRDEIVTINFNHEIKDPQKVFPLLNRQLQTQLRPVLNNRFRVSKVWPTLKQSIRTNRRLFVFYAPIIEQSPYNRIYRRHKWINNENLYGSTWRPFSVDSGCGGVVPLTADRCQVRQYRELVEVSIIPESGACVYGMAEMCRPYLHDALRACEQYRFTNGNSPNVLLVDYPEVGSQEITSVFHAVFHQNVRNILTHRSSECKVKIDAAVTIPGSDMTLIFVGQKMLLYNQTKKAQVDAREIPGLAESGVDAAYHLHNTRNIRIIKGCEAWDIDDNSFTLVSKNRSQLSPCMQMDAAVVWKASRYVFHECHVTPQGLEPISLSDWGLPCNIDAAMNLKDGLIIFKGNNYWNYTGHGFASLVGRVLDQTVDAVQCRS